MLVQSDTDAVQSEAGGDCSSAAEVGSCRAEEKSDEDRGSSNNTADSFVQVLGTLVPQLFQQNFAQVIPVLVFQLDISSLT